MSKILNVWFSQIEDFESQIRSTTLTFDGKPLRGGNLTKIQSLYIIWLAIICERLTASFTNAWKPTRLRQILIESDVRVLLSCCKEADALLLQSIDVGYPNSYDTFKQCLKEAGYPVRFVGELKAIIAYWYQSMDTRVLRSLRDILLFPTKVNLTLRQLKKEALEEYLLNEQRLEEFALQREPGKPLYTTEEASIIEGWFPQELQVEFEENVIPQHGNGSVANWELQNLSDKYGNMETDSTLEYFALHTAGWYPCCQVQKHSLVREARVTFVPKKFDGYRTISMEPVALMFYQEGIWNAFKTMQKQHRFGTFWKRYDPETQDPNRDLALIGSIAGRFTTIDLSAASDSVAWGLIQEWFRHTCLWRGLFCTRSRQALLPNGKVVYLHKFAPMGSAVNFLVECVVFAAITEAAISEFGGRPDRSSYRVYGDDIVVETRYASAVISRLQRNGFRVNMLKTYQYGATGYFRESCGIHCCDGHDVTPLVCSRKFQDVNNIYNSYCQPTAIPAIIDMCNTFYQRGYRLARGYLIHKLMGLPQSLRPAFGKTEGCILSSEPTNHHLRHEMLPLHEECYQDEMLICGRLRGPMRRERDDSVELYEFLRRTNGRDYTVEEPCVVDAKTRRGGARWVSGKTPAFAVATDPLAPLPLTGEEGGPT